MGLDPTTRKQFIKWILLLVPPLLLFGALHYLEHFDLEIEAPVGHVFIVGGSSLMGAFLAYIAGKAAHERQEPRVLLLSLAFFAISGFSTVHALLTPGVGFASPTTGLAWTQAGGYLLGATLLALSSLSLPASFRRSIIRIRHIAYTLLFVSMVVSFWVALQYPNLIAADSEPFPAAAEVSENRGEPEHEAHEYGLPIDRRLVWGTTATTVALLGLAAFRNIHDFRLTHLPLAAMVVSGILWLAVGQIGFAVSRAWHVSWWTYHALVFGGFSMILLGVVRHVGRGASLSESIMTLFVQDTVTKLERSYNETLVTMIASVEAKDAYTRGHSARVTLLATLIGEDLRLPPEHLRILHHAALLHDVGKIGIPDAILNKPGRLTEQEYAIVKEHPVTGEAMLKTVAALRPVLAGVRSHHERWDGRGYPYGLSGESISLDGRIIAVADVFDALTSARAYRSAWPFSQAVEEMRRGAGNAFDPRLLEAFLRTLPRYMEQLRRQPRAGSSCGIRDGKRRTGNG